MTTTAISSLAIAHMQQRNAASRRQPPASQGESARPLIDVSKRSVRMLDRARLRRAGNTLALYFVAVWSRFLGWQMRRATRLLLKSLDERTLADIGVRRDDIDVVLRDIERRKAHWYMSQ